MSDPIKTPLQTIEDLLLNDISDAGTRTTVAQSILDALDNLSLVRTIGIDDLNTHLKTTYPNSTSMLVRISNYPVEDTVIFAEGTVGNVLNMESEQLLESRKQAIQTYIDSGIGQIPGTEDLVTRLLELAGQ